MDDKFFNIRVPKRWARTGLVVLVTAIIVAPLTALASHQFTDVPNSNTFHGDISWLADNAVTKGCNPPANTQFCPKDTVTREQMAAFLHRMDNNLGIKVASVTGSQVAGTDASADGAFASTQITAPQDGVAIVQSTASWDFGDYVVVTWVEMDTGTPCDSYLDGDAIVGTIGAASGDAATSTDGHTSAGQGHVAVSTGSHTFYHCLSTNVGTSNNVDHALVVTWYPGASASVAASASGGSGTGTPLQP